MTDTENIDTRAMAWVTVDAVFYHLESGKVLLIRRDQPVKGQLALPGSFVRAGETPREAIERTILEKLGMEVPFGMRVIADGGEVLADPDGSVVKYVYGARIGEIDDQGEPYANEAEWHPIMGIGHYLPWDHGHLLMKALAEIHRV